MSNARLAEIGYALAIYPVAGLVSAAAALETVYRQIRDTGLVARLIRAALLIRRGEPSTYNLGGILGASFAPSLAQVLEASGGVAWVGYYIAAAGVISFLARVQHARDARSKGRERGVGSKNWSSFLADVAAVFHFVVSSLP